MGRGAKDHAKLTRCCPDSTKKKNPKIDRVSGQLADLSGGLTSAFKWLRVGMRLSEADGKRALFIKNKKIPMYTYRPAEVLGYNDAHDCSRVPTKLVEQTGSQRLGHPSRYSIYQP
jgi:hypothetical protein